MNRQRILERSGWFFWRCFASYFVRYRKDAVNDLIATLTEHGINPIGADGAPRGIHVERRTVDTSSTDGESLSATIGMEDEDIETTAANNSESELFGASNHDDKPSKASAPLPLFTAKPIQPFKSPPPSSILEGDAIEGDAALMKRVTQFCGAKNIQWMDNRPKNGALWVYSPLPTGAIAQQLIDWGFRFVPGKGWWLKK